jgi:hypothetical protein
VCAKERGTSGVEDDAKEGIVMGVDLVSTCLGNRDGKIREKSTSLLLTPPPPSSSLLLLPLNHNRPRRRRQRQTCPRFCHISYPSRSRRGLREERQLRRGESVIKLGVSGIDVEVTRGGERGKVVVQGARTEETHCFWCTS